MDQLVHQRQCFVAYSLHLFQATFYSSYKNLFPALILVCHKPFKAGSHTLYCYCSMMCGEGPKMAHILFILVVDALKNLILNTSV